MKLQHKSVFKFCSEQVIKEYNSKNKDNPDKIFSDPKMPYKIFALFLEFFSLFIYAISFLLNVFEILSSFIKQSHTFPRDFLDKLKLFLEPIDITSRVGIIELFLFLFYYAIETDKKMTSLNILNTGVNITASEDTFGLIKESSWYNFQKSIEQTCGIVRVHNCCETHVIENTVEHGECSWLKLFNFGLIRILIGSDSFVMSFDCHFQLFQILIVIGLRCFAEDQAIWLTGCITEQILIRMYFIIWFCVFIINFYVYKSHFQ